MCGICGELHLGGGATSAERVVAMRDSLTHRGPDAGGLYLSPDRRVGLGFRRLRVIDLRPEADQPMGNEDGSVQLVFNGEIYNFRALRTELEGKGHRFRSRSDSEVIVHLYEEEGAAGIARLDGMFACAIWDERAKRLTLGRDRAGKKPLFYVQSGDTFAFASEIKAFFQRPDHPLEIDPEVVPQYFIHGYAPSPRTMYRNVRQVEPATTLTVDADGRITRNTYWSLSLHVVPTARPRREAAVVDVRRLLTSAVERRLVSDVPLGAFLSGGVDSTVVVGLMSRLMGTPVRTFSIGFEGDTAYDETSFAREAAVRFGTDHTEFRVTPSAIDLVEKLVWHHDGPFGDASAIPTYILSKLTRDHVTVALTGDGGDELFAGYTRFAAAVAGERIPRPLRRLLSRSMATLPRTSNGRGPLAKARRFGQGIAMPLLERMTRWASLFYDDLEQLFNPECWKSLAPVNRLEYLEGELDTLAPMSSLGQLLYVNYRSYLLDDLLVKLDRCSMANALETRSPFLDRELTEYAAGLPDDFKLNGWRTKVILKEAFADLLPSSIYGRPKMGFGVPLDAWFRGDLRDYLRDMLLARDVRYAAYLSRTRVASLVEAHLSGRENIGLQLWTLLTFEVWLRLLPVWNNRPIAEEREAISPSMQIPVRG
jgi:asparagine synthase (glutamine-hydrolysing)